MQTIKEHNMKVGFAIKPNTQFGEVESKLLTDGLKQNVLGNVLVMTVEPGFRGQNFNSSVMPKLKKIHEWMEIKGLDFDIQVDGGITDENVNVVKENGANSIVAGT